ncbi:ZP domain-containing protein-like [Anoplopoma fimbria]|uniref:ZP domain-containing protein-like n=1 Tax=Anoplopoma fimbria TaxID=229290 RepID=UPI0023EBD486|nr:ZP domain-containing protein-like [Anoplopoma fimbria]
MFKCPVLAALLVFWLCHGSPVKANVICDDSTMTVGVEKSSYPGVRVDHLQINQDPNTACSIRSNSTHFYAVIPLNSCGTELEETDENLIFKNRISMVPNSIDVITRKCLLEVKINCLYPKRGNVTLSFRAHRMNVEVVEKGFGRFKYQFEFYPNRKYISPYNPDSYPLQCELKSRIYMQIEAISSMEYAEMFVESCRASPYDIQNYRKTYSIIENGCKVDSTVEIYVPSHQRQFKFSIEAFKFIGLHDQVYISCSVMMCEKDSPNTRCSQGCINGSRRKREAGNQTTIHFVSQGPLRLKRSAESNESPVLHLNLNLVFIAGCLLGAVGMISAVVMYKAKMSKVKYQPLLPFES